MKPEILRWVGFSAAIVAVLLATTLLGFHAKGTADIGLLEKVCGKEAAGCDKVVSSRWGVIPPGPPEPSSEEGKAPSQSSAAEKVEARKDRHGFPVAALGLFYYTFLAVYLGVIGRPSWPVRRLHSAIFALNLLGVMSSLFYIGVMLFAIGEACPFCYGTHVCNFLLAFVLWKTRPEEPKFHGEGEGISKPVLPHPDLRLGVTCLLLSTALCYGEWKAYRAQFVELQDLQITELRGDLAELNSEIAQLAAGGSPADPNLGANGSDSAGAAAGTDLAKENQQLRERLEELEEIASSVQKMDGLHLSQEKLDLGLRDDDPKITPVLRANGRTGKYMQVVVFSDVECSNCANFHEYIHEKLLPMFNGHLEVIYKHLPAGRHKHALPGAKALEAARLQGNDKFWALYSYLLERRKDLGSVDYTVAAQELGLDANRFVADMGSAAVRQRVAQDSRHATQQLQVKGTPAVFLNGRPVSRVIRRNDGWWQIKADTLKKSRARSRQEW